MGLNWPYSTARWRNLRVRKLNRDGARCEGCGTGSRLQVHHVRPLTTEQRKERNEAAGFPSLDELPTLCIQCHSDITSGVEPHERRRRAQWRTFLQ